MNCISCGYDLAGIPAGPCPECGRPFEPLGKQAVLKPLSRSTRRWLTAGVIVGCPAPLWPTLFVAINVAIARAILGRHPIPLKDDHDHISTLNSIVGGAGGLAMGLSVPLSIMALWMARVGMSRSRERRWVVALVLAILAWPLGFAAFAHDPLRMWSWALGPP